MSVTTTATSVSYIYQEGEVYSLPYEYQNEADVKASYIDSDGNKVNLAYNVDYTVGGSTVTLIAALPDGVTITFSRQTEITQQTELPQQTITKAIETAIDKNTMCVQEIATDQGTLRAEFNAFTANINQTIVRFEQSFDEFKISINQAIVNLEQNFDEFEKTVNQSITNFEQNFNDFKKEVNQTVADAIAEVEAIKETAITEMNDIKDETQNIANNVNVFIPFVNNGTLSWTNEAGLPNPAPVNIKGEQGSPGKDGVDGTDGTAATITIGTVTTGEPGSSASVINVGTDTAAVLAVSIPRGDKGADGTGAGDVIAAANNTFTAWNFFERLPRYTGTATNASSTEFLTKSIADTYYLGTDITQNVSFRGSNNFYGSVYLRNTVSVSGTITVPTPTTSSQAVNKGYVDTAVATTPAQLKTQSDMQLNTVITSTSLKADSTNVQSYTITSGGGIGISYFDASATLAGYVKTFVISVTRSGGAGTFKIGANHRIGDNIPSVYMVDGALPDIADGEVLKIAMEVNEPANAIFIYILGKVAL